MNEDERTRQQTMGAESDLIRPTPSIGAPLPPSQGGQSFSQTEMQVLAGGNPVRTMEWRPGMGDGISQVVMPNRNFGFANPRDAERPMAALDLDAVKKEVEESLSAIDTTAALEDAKKNLDMALVRESDDSVDATSGESSMLNHESDAGRMQIERIKADALGKAARLADPTEPKPRKRMTDAEAFASETTFVLPTAAELARTRRLPWD